MSAAVLSLNNVALCFPEQAEPILENINCHLHSGESVMILGGNGSGKSSLIKLINKHYSVSQGTISLQQQVLSDWNTVEFSKQVITLAQDPAQSLFYDLTVLENCLVWESRIHGNFSRLIRLSSRVEREYYGDYLQAYHPKLKSHLNTAVRLLSGGEKQALLLALCLQIPPLLLLLDEHTSALDPHQARFIMTKTLEITQKRGITTLMTTHNLEHALEFGDRLLAIKNGKIVIDCDSSQKQKLCREDLLKLCY